MEKPDASASPEDFARIEELLERIEQAPESPLKHQARALLQSVLRIHAAGISSMLEILAARPGGSRDALEAFAAHELVAQLLLLHGLHPLDLESRVRNVLDRERASFERAGVKAEFLSAAGGTVRIRLEGAADALAGMQRLLETRLVAEAPDAVALDIAAVALAPVLWRREGTSAP